MWNFSASYVNQLYVARRKAVRKNWDLPCKTHCNLLHVINDTIPIDVMLEKRCIQFIWACMHSNNSVVKSIMYSGMHSSVSVLGENYRYFSHKYDISPLVWQLQLSKVMHCTENFISHNVESPHFGYFIRELCIARDMSEEQFLTSMEMSQLIEYICTI